MTLIRVGGAAPEIRRRRLRVDLDHAVCNLHQTGVVTLAILHFGKAARCAQIGRVALQCRAEIGIRRRKVSPVARQITQLDLQLDIIRIVANGVPQQLERIIAFAIVDQQRGLQPHVLGIAPMILFLLCYQRVRLIKLARACKNSRVRNLDGVALRVL